MDFKNTPTQRPDNSICAPLTEEVTASSSRDKTFKKQREIKGSTRLQCGQQPERTGWLSPESKVIALDPDQIFTYIEKITENTRYTQKLITREAKKQMTDSQRRRERGRCEKKRLDPIPL